MIHEKPQNKKNISDTYSKRVSHRNAKRVKIRTRKDDEQLFLYMNMTFFEDENLVTYNLQQENKIKYYKLIVSTTAVSQVFTKLGTYFL